MKRLIKTTFILAALVMLASCGKTVKKENAKKEKKIGVLLVSHGSSSKSWRKMLLNVEDQVKGKILANKKISKVTSAFMEDAEPSIATKMKEFDAEGFDEVIAIPIFLTVSSHYSHDIPVIFGLISDPKAEKYMTEEEKMEIYKSKAKVVITPPLDYSTLLKKNVERRVKALSKDPENEGVLLVAYGDSQYNQQWEEMVDKIGKYLKIKTGINSIAYAWCGHLVDYSPEPTEKGIKQLLKLENSVIVIPVLVANDSYFQKDIIQKGVDMVKGNVLYKQDAILPDSNLNKWIIDIANKTVKEL